MTQVIAIRGPGYLLGRRMELEAADVAAATGVDGWAVEAIPGTVLLYEDTPPPWPADWEFPGYVVPDEFQEAEPVAITAISNANPAVVTVGAGEIGKFQNGDTVVIEGATLGFAVCNGSHVIGSVNGGAGTFALVGIDTSAQPSPSTTPGMTATPESP